MNLEMVNELCRELAEVAYEARAAEYLEMLREDELAAMAFEHDMQMYACHSYDLDAQYYGEYR